MSCEDAPWVLHGRVGAVEPNLHLDVGGARGEGGAEPDLGAHVVVISQGLARQEGYVFRVQQRARGDSSSCGRFGRRRSGGPAPE